MKADLSKEFTNLNLTEVMLISELQEHIFSLTQSTLSSTVKYISKSIFADSKERISQLVSNIFNAIKIRPSSTSLYAHFVKELISLASPENEFAYISTIILDPFPSITYPSFDRLAFLNECLKCDIISENQIFISIKLNYEKYPHNFLPWKYAFVWFMPLILKNDPKLFQDMYLELKKSISTVQNTQPIQNVNNSSFSNKDPNLIQSAQIINKENDSNLIQSEQAQPNLHSYSYEAVNSPLNNESHAPPPKADNLPPTIDGQHGNIPVMPIYNSQPHLNSNQPPNINKNRTESTSQESANPSNTTNLNRVRKNIKLSKTKFYSILNSTSETYAKAGNDQQTTNIYNNPTRELADFFDSIQYLKKDNWSLYDKMISNTYIPNSLPAILKEDRVHDLSKMIDKYNENERKRIKKIEIENETSEDYVYDYEEEEEEEEDSNDNGKKKRRILVKLSDGDSYEYESSSTDNDSATSSSRNMDSNNETKEDPESYSIRFQNTSGKFHSLRNSFRERIDKNEEENAQTEDTKEEINTQQSTENKEENNLTLNEQNNEKPNNDINNDVTSSPKIENKEEQIESKNVSNNETNSLNNPESNIALNKSKSEPVDKSEVEKESEIITTTQSSTEVSKRRRYKRPKRNQEVPEFVGFNLNQRIVSTVFEKNNFLRNGPTLIQFASFYGSVLCVLELVKRGADILLPDLSNKKTSMFAIAGGNMKIIEILEYQLDDFKSTPQVATYFIRQEAFNRLMSTNQFDLNQVDDHYASVLHQAAASNNIRVIIYCIENGVDVNIKNVKNFTPLHLAVSNGHLDASLLLASHKKIDINAKSIDGFTPLIVAAKNGYDKIVGVLLSNPNINVNEVENNHSTALHFAAALNKFEIVKMLVEHKNIDLSIKDNNGRNAAEVASLCGFNDCAKYIGEHMKSDCSIA